MSQSISQDQESIKKPIRQIMYRRDKLTCEAPISASTKSQQVSDVEFSKIFIYNYVTQFKFEILQKWCFRKIRRISYTIVRGRRRAKHSHACMETRTNVILGIQYNTIICLIEHSS